MSTHRVLVVENDDSVATVLVDALQLNGHTARRESTVLTSVEVTLTGWPDVVLLDLGLPDGDGLRACRAIRRTSAVPVIVVSARGSEQLKVEAFQAGADDYVTKPFGIRELLARIEAVLRRMPDPPDAMGELWLIGGDVMLDVAARQVAVAGQVRSLTRKELAILLLLVHARGQVVPRDVLGARVWGGSWVQESRTLDVHIHGLRTKLGQRQYIETVRWVGTRLGVSVEQVR